MVDERSFGHDDRFIKYDTIADTGAFPKHDNLAVLVPNGLGKTWCLFRKFLLLKLSMFGLRTRVEAHQGARKLQ